MNTSRRFISLFLLVAVLLSCFAITGCNVSDINTIPFFTTPAKTNTPNSPSPTEPPPSSITTVAPTSTPTAGNTVTPPITGDETHVTPNPTPTAPAITPTPVVTDTPDITPTSPITTEEPEPEIPLSKNEDDYFLSTDGLFSYSKNHNVVVFLLDRLDYDRITDVKKYFPTFFNRLDGFTLYTDATSEFARTLPGANHILTGYEKNVYIDTTRDFLDKSWSGYGDNILEIMKEAKYDVDIFANSSDMFGTPSKFARLVSNMSWDPALKDTASYEIDDYLLSTGIDGITATQSKNSFKLYHLNGPHQPYNLKSDGTLSEEPTSRLEQTMGCFQILFRFLNKMKELGIYESSEIIIIADHGDAISDYKPVQKATTIGLFHKPSGSSGNLLKLSDAPVSHNNVPATILKAMGVKNYSKYGTPLDEVSENAAITRYFYKSIMEDYQEVRVVKYAITGKASDFSNWKIIDEYDVKHHFYW